MSEFDDIDDLYRDMVDNFSGKPDNKNWSRLENNLDLNDIGIENWYKEKIENSSKVPNEQIWEDLSIKMDTDSVWKRLAISLQRRDRIIWWWQFSASAFTLLAAIGLILFSTLPINNYPRLTKTNQIKSVSRIQSSEKVIPFVSNTNPITLIKNETKKPLNSTTHKNKIDTNVKLVNTVASDDDVSNKYKTNSNIVKAESTDILISEKEVKKQVVLINNTQEKLPVLPAVSFITEANPKSVLLKAIPFHHDSLLEDYSNQKDYFYVEAKLINPWLINSNTYNAFRRNSSDYNKTLLTGGFGFGYVHWLNKFGIEGNLSYQEKGHNYMVYIEGKSFEKKINMDYAIASVLFKKRLTDENLKPWKSYISGGIYYGRALHQNTIFNGEPYTNAVNYAKNDFGFIISLESQFKLKNNRISLGIDLTQGLKNIYKGNDYKEFSKTYNFAMAGTVKYLIPLKK